VGIVVVILVLSVVAGGIWWSYARKRARREALLAFGLQDGFMLSREDPFDGRLRPTGLIPLFGMAKAFVDHVPKLVWTEYATEQRAATLPEGGGNAP